MNTIPKLAKEEQGTPDVVISGSDRLTRHTDCRGDDELDVVVGDRLTLSIPSFCGAAKLQGHSRGSLHVTRLWPGRCALTRGGCRASGRRGPLGRGTR